MRYLLSRRRKEAQRYDLILREGSLLGLLMFGTSALEFISGSIEPIEMPLYVTRTATADSDIILLEGSLLRLLRTHVFSPQVIIEPSRLLHLADQKMISARQKLMVTPSEKL